MKKLLITCLMLLASCSLADVPVLVQDACIITVTGDLDGWYMCVAESDMGLIGVGFFEEDGVCEDSITLSGDEMVFNLEDMGFYCSDVISNRDVSIGMLKALFK